jgi:hypothetical protein
VNRHCIIPLEIPDKPACQLLKWVSFFAVQFSVLNWERNIW